MGRVAPSCVIGLPDMDGGSPYYLTMSRIVHYDGSDPAVEQARRRCRVGDCCGECNLAVFRRILCP